MEFDSTAAAPLGGLPPVAPAPALHVVEPRRGWAVIDLGEVWQWRELVYFLVWRDVKVRYKQTAFGAGATGGRPPRGAAAVLSNSMAVTQPGA